MNQTTTMGPNQTICEDEPCGDSRAHTGASEEP